MIQYEDWESGKKYNKLMCTGKSYQDEKKVRFVEVICECGIIKWMRLYVVKKAKSCGCENIEWLKEGKPHTLHGLRKHPLYNVYRSMMGRCYTESNIRFDKYGKIGVVVCQEWIDSFKVFFDWAILNGWAKGLEIDKDIKYKEKFGTATGKIYSPEFCCFVTPKENCRNRTTSRFIEFNGQSKTMVEWAEDIGIKKSTLSMRLNNFGWSVEKALTTPLIKYKNGLSGKPQI